MDYELERLREYDPQTILELLKVNTDYLNGNTTPVVMDGGAGASRQVGLCVTLLAGQVQAMPELKDDPNVAKIVDALAELDDVTDVRAVAQALKSVDLEPRAKQPAEAPKPNPFA